MKSLLFIAILTLYCCQTCHADNNVFVDDTTGSEFVVEPETIETEKNNFQDVKIPSSAVFVETFQDDDWTSRWNKGDASKAEGEFTVEQGPSEFVGIQGDVGLVLKSAAKRTALSTRFDQTITFDQQAEFVVQYEVRLHKDLACGGAYIKLLAPSNEAESSFSDASPYSIMFGPDRCGATDKVHFIFRHEHPISHEIEEKHFTTPPSIMNDRFSHVYTLAVFADGAVKIYIDLESKEKGTLVKSFEPSLLSPRSIPDPSDEKPTDWIDEKTIADVDAIKPDDWDENAPELIIDEMHLKPETWLDDEPAMIADPEAEQPQDWDVDVDGEWSAPQIDNPACAEFGCGEWQPRMVSNPAYQGKWHAPLIPNPAYKGEWQAKPIDNPNYFELERPVDFIPIAGIGIEVWSMQNDMEFDNIFVGRNIDDALRFAELTWRPKFNEQKKQFQASRAKAEASPQPDWSDMSMMDRLGVYMAPLFTNPLPYAVTMLLCTVAFFWFMLRRSMRGSQMTDKVQIQEGVKDDTDSEDEDSNNDDADDDDDDDDENNGSDDEQ